MAIIKLYAQVVNGQSLDSASGCEQTFDCVEVASIKNAYAIRKVCCGGSKVDIKVSLTPSSPADANDVTGVLITKENGLTFFAAGHTADEATTACNACCGEITVLDQQTMAAFTNPSASSAFCLTTTGDDGTTGFVSDLAQRIYGKYDVTKGISRFATNKFNFFTTDPIATIILPTGWSVAAGACA